MSDFFFKRDDLSKWTDGNNELIRSMEGLVQRVRDSAKETEIVALTAALNALTAAFNNSLPVYGSNANGDWVRFSNGITVQWGNAPVATDTVFDTNWQFNSVSKQVTFPVPFVGSLPMVSVTVESTVATGAIGAGYISSRAGSTLISLTGFGAGVVMSGTGGATFTVQWFAVGLT